MTGPKRRTTQSTLPIKMDGRQKGGEGEGRNENTTSVMMPDFCRIFCGG